MPEPYIFIAFLLALGVDLSNTNKIHNFFKKINEQRSRHTNS